MKRFEGKAALVVGAAMGIGAAAAERLAQDGASVVLADIDLAAAEGRAEGIRRAGGTAIAVRADLADEASLKAVIDQTCATYGGLDFLVNSGFMRSASDLTVTDTPQEIWDQMMDVNLMGYVRSCRHGIPRIIERGGGAIVNLTTGSHRLSEPRRVVYGVSKIGIQALTRHIAVTYGPQGIRANIVAPGLTLTENVLKATPAGAGNWAAMSPLRRAAEPREVAAAIAFLLSDDASHISGETLGTDGGKMINAG